MRIAILAGGIAAFLLTMWLITGTGQEDKAQLSRPPVPLRVEDPSEAEDSVNIDNENPPSATPRSHRSVIEFPDGDLLDIRWRRHPKAGVELTENLSQDYDVLRHAAEGGDGLAAQMLYENIFTCQKTYATREELEHAIDTLQQTNVIPQPDTGITAHITEPEKIDEIIENLRRQYASCSRLSIEQRDDEQKWLELAVANGNSLAMLEYGRALEDPVQAGRLFQQAWFLGNADALSFLADRYRESYENGVAPDDKVRWYAALYVFSRLLDAAHGGETGVAARWAQRNRAILDEATKDMLPHELDEAVELAKQMIRSNSNCCFEM